MDPFGPGCDVVRLTAGANQAIDNTAGDGLVVGMLFTPGSTASTVQLFRNNGGTVIADMAAPLSTASIPMNFGGYGLVYSGAQPSLSATVVGTGAILEVYYKKRH